MFSLEPRCQGARPGNTMRRMAGRAQADHELTFALSQDETLRRMARAGNYNAWLLERSSPYLGRRVLDVGAGIGTFTERVAERAELVVAAEPDPRFVAALRSRFETRENVRVVDTTIDALAADVEERFDSIICFNVLEHVRDDEAALRAFHRQLAPGGCLLLLVPAHPFLFGSLDRTVEHERRYAKGPLRRSLLAAGFEVDVLRHVNPVGALGWLVSGRLLHRELIPEGPLRLFDRLVPLLRMLDALRLPLGLSLWGVARAS